MEIFKKGIISFLYNVLAAIIGFAIQFFAAKILGATDFGKYNYFMGIANSLVLIFSFGISFYFPKVFQNNINKKVLISGVFYTSIILLIIVLPFITIAIDLSRQLDNYLLFLMAFSLIALEFYRSYLIGIGKADSSTKNTAFFVKLIILISFLIFTKFLFTSHYSLIYVTIFANIIIVIPFLWSNLKKVKPNFSFLKKSYMFYLIQLFYMFFGEYSKVLQGDFFDYKVVGFLSISLLIGQVITIFGQNFANVGMPIFAKAFVDKDFNMIRVKFQEISRINAFFLIPVFLVFFFNAKLILSFVGEEYIEGAILLKLILCGAFINSIVGPNGTVLLMGNKNYYELFNGILKFFIVVVFVFLLGKDFIWGVAFAIAISDVLVNLMKAIEVYYLYKVVPFSYKESLYILLFSIVGVIPFYFLSIYFEDKIILILFNVFFVPSLWFLAFKFSPNKLDRMILKKINIFAKTDDL